MTCGPTPCCCTNPDCATWQREQAIIQAAFKWYKQEDDTWWHEDICDCSACDLARAVIELKNGSVRALDGGTE